MPRTKIVDGSYEAMVEKLRSDRNPSLLLLHYSSEYQAKNVFCIPKHFFVPSIIERRKPLSPSARRAGGVGCNILLKDIPESGKVFIVKNGHAYSPERVTAAWRGTEFLANERLASRGWLLEAVAIVDALPGEEFDLENVSASEEICGRNSLAIAISGPN